MQGLRNVSDSNPATVGCLAEGKTRSEYSMKGIAIFPDTKDKFAEAKYFLDRMIREKNSTDHAFRFNTSAFVVAAESVVALLSVEANNPSKSKFNIWRAEQISILNEDQFKRLINEQRRVTTHTGIIRFSTDVTVYPIVLKLEFEVHPVMVSVSGNNDFVVSPTSAHDATIISGVKKPEFSPVKTTRSETTHYFLGHRDRDVISICTEHLNKLDELIKCCEAEYKK